MYRCDSVIEYPVGSEIKKQERRNEISEEIGNQMESWWEKVDERKPGANEGGPARMRSIGRDKRDILTGRGKK